MAAVFTQAMLDGRSPTLSGDGTQTRDFVYVTDVAQANLLATRSQAGQVANIASEVETSVNDIYRMLADLAGYRGKATYAAPREGDVYRIALSTIRAKQWLGWTPSTTLTDGLKRTVEWFRARRK